MALETATYIADLDPANPPGTDPVAQADDHLRMIKQVLQNTFPNQTEPFVGVNGIETGAVTADPIMLLTDTAWYWGTTLAEDGFPSNRYVLDTGNSDHDWYMSRGVQYVGGQWQLAAANVSPSGIFGNNDNTQSGIVRLAADNYNRVANVGGTNIDRPENWNASIEVNGNTGDVRLMIQGTSILTADTDVTEGDRVIVRNTLRLIGTNNHVNALNMQLQGGASTLVNSTDQVYFWFDSTAKDTRLHDENNLDILIIDDLATKLGVSTLAHTIEHQFDDRQLNLKGGSGVSSAAIHLFGSTHATLAGDMAFRSSSADFMFWDESAGELRINTGTGGSKSTLATFTTGNMDVAGTVTSLGAVAGFLVNETDASLDQKIWAGPVASGESLTCYTTDDLGGNTYTWLALERSGTGAASGVDTIDFTSKVDVTFTTPIVNLGNLAFDADQTVGAGQDNYILTYDNASGEISLEPAAGGGNVSNSGTPVDNQLAIWTSSTVIEGLASFTFDAGATTGNQFAITAATGLTAGNAMSIGTFPAGFLGDALDINVNNGTGNGIRITHQTAGVTSALTITENSAGGLAGTFYSNVASRTQPLVLVHNDNPTGSQEALEVRQDHSGPNILLSGTNGEGIKFPATANVSTDANTLDDYQEGAYTATLTPRTSGSITIDGANNSLSYTKIGREVHVQGFLNISSVSSPSGIVELNLPFTVDPQTEGRENSGCTIAAFGLTTGTLPAHASVIGFTHGGFNVLRIFVASLGSATLVDFGDHCSSSTDLYLDFHYISDQ